MIKEILIRILLSPIILIWYIFLLGAATIFPFPILVIISFISMVIHPFIWLLKKSGSEVENFEPFIILHNDFLSHLAGATIYLWILPFGIYDYIKTGDIFKV